MEDELRGLSGVRSVSAHVGRAVMSDKTTDIYSGEVWVNVNRAADYDATVDAIRAVASGYAGYDIDVDTFLAERLLDETGPTNKVVVRVYGENMETLRSKAEEVRAVMAGVEGLETPEVQYPDLRPNLEIEPNIIASMEHGLTPGDIRRKAATLLGGIQVGSLFEERKVFDVIVWGVPEVRHSLSSVENLLLDTPAGGHVRLKDVASAKIKAQPHIIHRNAVARHIDVEAEVAGRDVAAVAADVSHRVRQRIDFPLEHRAEVLGAHAAAAASMANVRSVAIVATLGVLLLLQAAFGSWSLAFFVLASLPVALLGGVATGLLAGGIGSMGSLLGFLAVLALAVRGSLVLVSRYRELEKEAGASPSAELVHRGTREQFGSIVTTAIVSVAVFAPIALFGNIAGLEILHSMAAVVIGGVITLTLVHLVVVPVLYLAYAGSSESLEIIEEEVEAA
jgi:Cu/Ag efflux pump CusA